MNKEEKSLLDELFDAAGLGSNPPAENPPEQPAEEQKEANEIEIKKEILEEIGANKPKTQENIKFSTEIEEISEEKSEKDENKEIHETKKKDIKFLVIYTIIFVIVISGLLGGSYIITSRIHQQMAENNQDLNTSQSTLKNIKDENNALKQENAALKEQVNIFSTTASEAEELLENVADMVEQDGYLTAAQSAYIDGDRAEARQLMQAIDREKLSQPAKEHYDLLKEKLGL